MKVYQAIGVHQELKLGGSTQPWVVWVKEEGQAEPILFVVKLFQQKDLDQYYPVAKEAFGMELAREFDLHTPDWGLVFFGEELLETLSEEHLAIWKNKAPGLKFGTKYEEGYVIFDDHHLNGSQLQDYDLGTLFAFDQLVWNLDRGGYRNKPNLLVNDEDFLLIDHEQIFPFANEERGHEEELLSEVINRIASFPSDRHLLFPYLKGISAHRKAGLFDTFAELLRHIRISRLIDAKNFLEEHSVQCGNFPLIKRYLEYFSQHPTRFLDILRTKLS